MNGILPGLNSKPDVIGSLFRIANNQGKTLTQGQTFTFITPKIIQGKIELRLAGQNITLENFPKSLQGKNITLKVVKQHQQTSLQLMTIGKSIHKEIGEKSESKTEAITPKNKPTSQNLKNNTEISIISSTKNKASIRTAKITSSLRHLPQQHQSMKMVVIQSVGKTAELQTLADQNIHHAIKTKSISEKSPPAITHMNKSKGKVLQQQQNITTIKINHLSAPLKKGQQLTLEINQAANKNNIILKNIEQPINQGNNIEHTVTKKIAAFNLKNMPENHPFSVKVAQRLPSGNISFHWQGQSFETPAPKHIQIGDTLLLKIDNTGKKTHLAVLDVVQQLPEKASTLLRQSMPQSTPMGQVLKTLIQLNTAAQSTPSLPDSPQLNSLTRVLKSFTLTPGKPLDAPRLMSMIRDSGLMHEALLGKWVSTADSLIKQTPQANLKSVLISIEKTIRTAHITQQSNAIQHIAEQGVHRIETQQALNLFALQQAEPIRIELPLIMQGQLSTVQIAIDTQADHGEETSEDESPDERFNILFSLHLSHLGSIRIDARMSSQSVYANFYTENNQASHFIQQNISRLTERLEANGFQDIQLSTSSHKHIVEEKSEKFNRLEAGFPIFRGLLDVTG